MIPEEESKYVRAKKRLEEIKGFYAHLAIYLGINLLMLLAATGVFKDSFMPIQFPTWSYFTTPFFWGIAIFIHWIWVFKSNLMPFKGWEERKIKQFMEAEEKEFPKHNSWE